MVTDRTQADAMVYGFLAGCGSKSQVTLAQIAEGTGLPRITAMASVAALNHRGAICLAARTSDYGRVWYAILHMHPDVHEGDGSG